MTRTLLCLVGLVCLSIFFAGEAEASPTTGTIEVAFILSEFQDQEYQSEHDQDYFEDLAFGETDSMWEYFDEVSRSQLNIQGDVYGPYTLDGDAADYGTENLEFVRDSVEIADDYINYTNYDAVMVIHSGPGEESSGNSDDIWSIHWPSADIETEDDGFVIKEITQAPEYETISGENNPLGVWCHEFGHELGLPDLYDTDGSSAGIGDWGIMASGSWGNNGETPVYMSAWSRFWLGWIEPIVITDDINNLELRPIENDGDVYLLPIPGNWSNSKEYYLLENRQKIKYDAYLPSEGLLIWHIDEDILNSKWNSNSVNNDEGHKGVDLEEADGDDDLDSKTNYGDSGDPYTSGTFSKDGYPNSLAYNGTESGWKIENIETNGDNIIIDVSFLSKPHAIADADEAVITEGFELQFYGNESWDEDGTIVNYTWDFGDGNFEYTDNPTHIFIQNGTYDVVLTVTDNDGLKDIFVLNIFVNKPPIPIVNISELIIMLGDTINFNASGSYDIDGEIEFYYWNFDDGYTSNQAIANHEFKDSGLFNVSLKIIDNLNEITTIYYIIEVVNRLPIVDFEKTPTSGNTKVIFEFSDLSYDEDGEIEEWNWDFGDGENSNLQNTNHLFSLPGIYIVNLTVIDDQGGINSTTKNIEIYNSPPEPDITIPGGINTGPNQWIVAANKLIELDGSVSIDNENDALAFYWTFNDEEFTGEKINLIFTEYQNEIILRVLDSRGNDTTEIFSVIAENIPILSLEASEINLVIEEEIVLQSTTNWGQLDIYQWIIVDKSLLNEDNSYTQIYNQTNIKSSINFSLDTAGEYILYLSGRHPETNLWTIVFPLSITVYNNPVAYFEFYNDINEGDWITFDGKNSTGLDITFSWILDGITVAGEGDIINILIDSGGEHNLGLIVNQDPVGTAYFEKKFYTNYKPTGILSTNPSIPRYGEDFEVYLAAYDVESEAIIEHLNIKVYNENGDKAWEESYNNQGSNFNVVFEMQYTGEIILDYKLVDDNGNIKENSTSVDVLGWADIYVESFNINGEKEKGKKQTFSIILTNYNETYQSSLYNGYQAKGELELIMNSEIIHTWTYEIDPTKSQEFNFEWIAITGYHTFEVKATVLEGEVIKENNNLSLNVTVEAKRESGLLISPSINLTITLIIIIATISRRKPN